MSLKDRFLGESRNGGFRMKRLCSIFLAILMLFTLCVLMGCEKEETVDKDGTTGQTGNAQNGDENAENQGETGGQEGVGSETVTQEMLENSKPCEYLREKLDAGMEPLLALSMMSLDSQQMQNLDDGLAAYAEQMGFSYSSASAGDDATQQLIQVENFITMQAAIIVVNPNDPMCMAELSAAAVEAGSYTIMRGSVGDFVYSVNCTTDHEKIAETCANMAIAWIDERYPDAGEGDIHAALIVPSMVQDFVLRRDKVKEVFAADPRIVLSYDSDDISMGVDQGYNLTEAAYTYDSEIRLFIFCTSSAAIGGSNYIVSQNVSDLSEFACFAMDTGDDAVVAIDNSATDNGSCFRGTVSAGGVDPSESVIEVIEMLLEGDVPVNTLYTDPVFAYSSFGFAYDERS